MKKLFGIVVLIAALTDPAYAMKRNSNGVRTREYLPRACKKVIVQPTVVITEPEKPEQEHEDKEVAVCFWVQQAINQVFIDYGLEDLINIDSSTFKKIIQELRVSWKATNLEQHPNVFHKKSEEEWLLLVKKNTMKNEFNLMRLLIDRVLIDKIEENIECSNKWIDDKDNLYLWVKKASFDEFMSIFKLEIT